MGVVSVNQHGNLFFYFRFNGRKYREGTGLKDTPHNRDKAEKYIRLINAEIAVGAFDYAKRFPHGNKTKPEAAPIGATFREYADTWLIANSPDKPDGLSPSTHEDYAHILLNQVYPILGGIPLSEISKASIKGLRTALSGLSSNRMKAIFKPIRGVISEALEDELIAVDPITVMRSRRGKGTPMPDVYPFSLKEIDTFKLALPWYWRLFVDVACFTGLRTSELLALKWSNVHLDTGYIQVREAVVRARVGPPKNKSSIRDVLMLPPVRNALLELMAGYCMTRRIKRKNARGYWKEHLYNILSYEPSLAGKYVFTNNKGGMWENRNIRERVWYPALERVGLRKRGLYQTRHTYASLMLLAGERPLWVANQMGHVDVNMIFERYAKYMPKGNEGSAFAEMYKAAGQPYGQP